MIAFPHCKINLGLHVVNKRSDGFHNIETIFYPVWHLHDVLEIIPSEEFIFTASGIILDSSSENNICCKAYNLLAAQYPISPVHIHLHKCIPFGAGLGGGSADGAFTIRLINEIFSLNLGVLEMMDYCRQLGSDCSFFVESKPIYAMEKGDVFQPVEIDLSGYKIVLVKPEISVATSAAYAGLVPCKSDVFLPDVVTHPIIEWKGLVKNDFEKYIFQNHPILNEIKQKLYDYGAIYASMTGSGSVLFGIFDKKYDLSNIMFDNMFVFKGCL